MVQKEAKIKPLRPEFLRDLSTHVEKSFEIANNGEGVSNELWSTELKAFLDAQTLKSLFFSEEWVYIVCDLIASKISSQPLKVVNTQTVDGGEVVTPLPDHPLNELIEQPNEWQDYSQWMYSTAVELFLMGNAIVWYAPRSGQLMTVPTESIAMDFDPQGKLRGYFVTSTQEEGAPELNINKTNTQFFSVKDIIHVRRPNPSSLLWGLSPWVPGRKSILFQRYSSDYLNAFYLKQATPGLALSLDRTVNEDVALRQLRSFEVAYQGRKNTRRTLVLPKGVSATTLTHSLSDQKLIDHINQNRETICALLKVPKHELGLQTAGSLGSEEYKTALKNFWEATLIPGMKFIAGALSKFFQKKLGEGNSFRFDLSQVEALKDNILQQADLAIKMLQAGLSVNEVRARVWKEAPSVLAGSDDPFVMAKPAAPVSNFSAMSAPVVQQLALDTQQALPATQKINFTPEVEAIRSAFSHKINEEESRTIQGLTDEAIKLLVGMTEEAIDVVLESNKSMPIIQIKELPSKRVLERRIESALISKYEESWSNTVAKTLKQSVDLGYDQSLQMVFNARAREEVAVLRDRDTDKRRNILQARGLDSFAHISTTQTEAIMLQIEKGVAGGESITNIMRSVARALGTPENLLSRAERIARTETLTAVSIGQAAAVENAKEVIPGLKKGWMNSGDDRVRDAHKSPLHGEVVGVDEKFSNGLRYPRDTNALDAAEVINCRCTLLLLPPGEKLEIPE